METCGMKEVRYANHEGDSRYRAAAWNPPDPDGEGRAHPGHPAGGGNFDCFGTAAEEECSQEECLWREECFRVSVAEEIR